MLKIAEYNKTIVIYGFPDYYVFKGDIKNVLDLLKGIK